MDDYCDVIKKIMEAREDPAQLEEYFYLMLEDEYGYETTRAKIEDYFENHSPFCIRVNGRNFRKENLNKDRRWPMLGDMIWDEMIHESSEARKNVKCMINILSSEANREIDKTGKEYYEEYDEYTRSKLEREEMKEMLVDNLIDELRKTLNKKEDE